MFIFKADNMLLHQLHSIPELQLQNIRMASQKKKPKMKQKKNPDKWTKNPSKLKKNPNPKKYHIDHTAQISDHLQLFFHNN